jgi:hypothetical protein
MEARSALWLICQASFDDRASVLGADASRNLAIESIGWLPLKY